METFIAIIFLAAFAALYVYFYKRHSDKNSKILAGLMCSGLIIGSAFLIIFNIMEIAKGGVTFAEAAVRFLFVIILTGYVLWLIFIKGKDA